MDTKVKKCVLPGACRFRSSGPVYGLVDWLAMVWSKSFPLEPVESSRYEENAFLVPVRALRDRGAQLPVAPSRYMEMQIEAISAIEQVTWNN